MANFFVTFLLSRYKAKVWKEKRQMFGELYYAVKVFFAFLMQYLEPLYAHSEDGEETSDDGDDEESVDNLGSLKKYFRLKIHVIAFPN